LWTDRTYWTMWTQAPPNHENPHTMTSSTLSALAAPTVSIRDTADRDATSASHRDLAAQSDEELLLRVRQGDRRAYAELYERHHRVLKRYARSLVPADDVDDLVAESFTAMLRAIKSGKGPVDTALRYLMVVVRNGAVTFYQRRAKATETVARLALEPTPEQVELTADPHLDAAFRSLSPRWQQVLWWSEIEDLPPTEIGERLGLAPTAASALAYRARRALRAAYESLSDAERETNLAMR